MSDTVIWIALVLLGYLLGAIPFAFLAGLYKGIDLRKVGSKNIGASNAGRVLGRRWFFIVLALDALKGFLPVLITGIWLTSAEAFGGAAHASRQQCAWLVVALAAILGHLFPIYLGFRGGRGVATSLGVVLAIWPYYSIPGLLALVLWIVILKVTGYISVASIGACAAFPILLVLAAFVADWPLSSLTPLIGFAVAIALLVILRHGPNIRRLLAGQELRPDRPDAIGDETTEETA